MADFPLVTHGGRTVVGGKGHMIEDRRSRPVEVLGIDFGTSNTVAVLAGGGRPPRLLAVDGASWMSSAVFVEDDGSLAVGRDAERKARLAPERFEPNPKRRVDDGEILLGVRVVPVVDAIAAVLHRVGEETRRQLNGRNPDQVNLTHPAQWGSARQNVLLAAARAAGLGGAIGLLPEPVGAATHFASMPGNSLPPGAALAVYDLGGGTFDCAVVGATAAGYTVLAEAGLPDVGGVDFDQTILDHLGRTAAAVHPGRWQSLTRPRTAGDRRAARALREDVRAAKETLSRYSQTDLPLPEPFEDTLLTRREFDGLIRGSIVRTVELLATTIERAGVTPQRLAGVYLVGGSSRIPLVATVISEKLGVVASTLDQPETSVAMGAAITSRAIRPAGRTESLGPGSGPRPPVIGAGGAPGAPAGPMFAARPPVPTGVPRPPSGPAGPIGPASSSGPHPGVVTGPHSGSHPGAISGPHSLPPASSRRRLLIVMAVVAVLVVAVTVTAIVIATRGTDTSGGDTPTTSSSSQTLSTQSGAASRSESSAPSVPAIPASCASEPIGNDGMTPCMLALAGPNADRALGCVQAPDGTADLQSVLGDTVPVTYSVCAGLNRGRVDVIYVQFASADESIAAIDTLVDQLSLSAKAWNSGSGSGRYVINIATDGPQVYWSYSGLPVIAVATTDTSDLAGQQPLTEQQMREFWESSLLPQSPR